MSCNIALITGANSMDAKTLTHLLLSKGYKVILTYRRNSYFDEQNIKNLFRQDLIENTSSELLLEVCDISCQNSVNECIKSILRQHSRIDEIYMLAAMSHVGNSYKQKELCIQTNGMSYYYFLEAVKNLTSKTKLYGALTTELFAGTGEAVNEESPWRPKTPYAISKALAGRWIQFYRESKDSGIFACFGILGNHSNQYRSLDFAIRKITNAAAQIALGKKNSLVMAHTNWARDEHWSDFGCEMMWRMLQQPNPEDFAIGTGIIHHAEEYLYLAFNYFNLDFKKYLKLDESLSRPNEVHYLLVNSQKAQKKLGWKPQRMSFKNHIELMCQYDYALEKGEKPERPNVFKLYA